MSYAPNATCMFSLPLEALKKPLIEIARAKGVKLPEDERKISVGYDLPASPLFSGAAVAFVGNGCTPLGVKLFWYE